MSPSPTSRAGAGLAIGLCPDAVGIVRLGGWRHARVDGQEVIDLAEPDADGMAALAALDAWLQQDRSAPTGLRRWIPAPAQVVLSDRLVRYARIPWSAATLSRQEEETLSRACFEERYGDMSDWTIRAEAGCYGQGRLAAAMPSALMNGLQRVLHMHRLRCTAVTPYFNACWNRWQRDIAQTNGTANALFAVVDAGMAVIGVIDGADRSWRSLRSLHLPTDAPALLPVLDREAVMLGLPEQPTIWMHSPQPGVLAAGSDNCHVLSMAAGLPAPIAMALSGIAT